MDDYRAGIANYFIYYRSNSMNHLMEKIDHIKHTITQIFNEILAEQLINFVDRFERKIILHFTKNIPNIHPAKGMIYNAELGYNIGTEIFKARPCIVYSAQFFNTGGNIIVIPLSSHMNIITQKKKKIHYTKQIFIKANETSGLHNDSIASLTNIRSISKKRLGKYFGKVSEGELMQIDKNIKKIFLIK